MTEDNPNDETAISILNYLRSQHRVAVEEHLQIMQLKGKLDTYRRRLWQREWEPPGV